MRNKKVTKIMSYLLTTAMIVGGLSLSPLATVEVMAATPMNVNLNVGNSIAGIGAPTSTSDTATSWTGSKVYMGTNDSDSPILWRVLDPDNASAGALGASGYAFLLSEELFLEGEPYHSRRENITWADC